jgi:hypothetical protein
MPDDAVGRSRTRSDVVNGTLTMLDRRQFLSTAAAGGTWLLASKGGNAHEPSADAHKLAHPELLAALGPATVREIGEAYRALVPTESDRTSLESALRAELHAAVTSNEDPIRADFAAGRVIVVRDWILSVTEARQCALYSLRRP